MLLQVKVRIKKETLNEFARKIMLGGLNKSAMTGSSYNLADDPAVSISFWEVENMDDFNEIFKSWEKYVTDVETTEVIKPQSALFKLNKQK